MTLPMEANALSEKSLAILDKGLGSEHPRLIPVLDSRAKLLRQLGRAAEADAVEVRAKTLKQKQRN